MPSMYRNRLKMNRMKGNFFFFLHWLILKTQENYKYFFSSPDNVTTKNRTQFVVTLDSKEYRGKKRQLMIQNNQIQDTLPEKPKRTKLDKNRDGDRIQSPVSMEINQKVNKLIIKNDTEDEEELRKEVENSTSLSSRRKRTPIKFEVDSGQQKKRSRSRERKSRGDNVSAGKYPDKDSDNDEMDRRRRDSRSRDRQSADAHKIKTSKNNNNKKYDNLPPREY